MTHKVLNTAEDALIEIATVDGHLATAMTLIRHGQTESALLELRQARICNHRSKLHVMGLRWLKCPSTFHRLIEEQLKWLSKRYSLS